MTNNEGSLHRNQKTNKLQFNIILIVSCPCLFEIQTDLNHVFSVDLTWVKLTWLYFSLPVLTWLLFTRLDLSPHWLDFTWVHLTLVHLIWFEFTWLEFTQLYFISLDLALVHLTCLEYTLLDLSLIYLTLLEVETDFFSL